MAVGAPPSASLERICAPPLPLASLSPPPHSAHCPLVSRALNLRLKWTGFTTCPNCVHQGGGAVRRGAGCLRSWRYVCGFVSAAEHTAGPKHVPSTSGHVPSTSEARPGCRGRQYARWTAADSRCNEPGLPSPRPG